jgi:hypothetical protein
VDNGDLRNYPSPWWSLWAQRLGIAVVGIWGAVEHAWLSVVIAVAFIAMHIWMVHRFRVEKVARDAHFAAILRRLSDEQ